MDAVEFIELVWKHVPAETRRRIEKMASAEKKTLAEYIPFLLSSGVNTLTPFFISSGC